MKNYSSFYEMILEIDIGSMCDYLCVMIEICYSLLCHMWVYVACFVWKVAVNLEQELFV